MSRLQTILFALIVGTVAILCAGLGTWQLSRLAARRALNEVALAARSAPVLDLSAGNRARPLDQRRLAATGRFDRSRTYVLRSRPHRGVPGVEIVTPFVIEGSDTALLVNLGFAPTADAVHVDRAALAIPDSARVTGVAVALMEDRAMAQAVVSRGDTTWRHVVVTEAAERLPYPVFPVMLYQSAEGEEGGGQGVPARYPRALPVPPLDDGPHLSYAVQWFSFALIAVIGGGLWLRKALT